jgi:hypothetical protein
MKHAAIAVLLGSYWLWAGAAGAQESGNTKFQEEAQKQEHIYRSQGEAVPSGYVIDRGLALYAYTLPTDFERALANLGPTDRWLDIGAGMGQAVLDYYTSAYDTKHAEGRERRGQKAQAVAMSIEDRRTAQWHHTASSLAPKQISYFFGKPLREYSFAELGKYQIITDLLGGFSYTEDLSLFMEKTLGFLHTNGSFYTVLQDVHAESGANVPFYNGAPYLTEILNGDGSKLRVCSWLKSISCVKVTCELKPGWKPPIEIYHVQKVCDNVTVPKLVPTHFAAGTPPERRFQLITNPPATAVQSGAAR